MYFLLFTALFIYGFYLLNRTIEGDFTILTTEEIKNQTYLNHNENGKFTGRETFIVYKITYVSGKIKFKTKSFKH